MIYPSPENDTYLAQLARQANWAGSYLSRFNIPLKDSIKISFSDEKELMFMEGFRVQCYSIGNGKYTVYGLVPGVRQWKLSKEATDYLLTTVKRDRKVK